MVAATCTAFYMFRLYFMTFSGDYRAAHVEGHPESEPEHAGHDIIPSQPHLDDGDTHSDKAHGHHAEAHDPHESPWSMTGVLWILAILSVVGGFVGIPEMFGGAHPTLLPALARAGAAAARRRALRIPEAGRLQECAADPVVDRRGHARLVHRLRAVQEGPAFARATRLRPRFAFLHRLLENKYYVDESTTSSSSAARSPSAGRCRGSTRTSSTASSTASATSP